MIAINKFMQNKNTIFNYLITESIASGKLKNASKFSKLYFLMSFYLLLKIKQHVLFLYRIPLIVALDA